MSEVVQYHSIKSIIWEWLNHSGEGDDKAINERNIIRLANSALKRAMPVTMLDEKIAVLPVEQGRATIPSDWRITNQIGYSRHLFTDTRCYDEIEKCAVTLVGEDFVRKPYCRECRSEKCRCGKNPVIVIPSDLAWQEKNPEFVYKFQQHYYSHFSMSGNRYSAYHPEFMLIRRKQGNFFQVGHIKECVNLRINTPIEYDFKAPNIILNTHHNGTLLMSYMGLRTDDDGYPMIPDNEYLKDYILYFIDERLAYQECRRTKRQDECNFHQLAELKAREALKTVRAKAIPSYDKMSAYLKNKFNKLFPLSEYDSFNTTGIRLPDQYHEPLQTSGNLDQYVIN